MSYSLIARAGYHASWCVTRRDYPARLGEHSVDHLLRMTAEKNGVAAKVLATVDDLERIAESGEADVPALKGWRREMFGEKALALKDGKLALAIEKGRVRAIER